MAAVVAEARRRGLTAETAVDDIYVWPGVNRRMQQVLAELRDGRGLVLLSGLPVDRFSKDELQLIFCGLGRAMGSPVAQSAKGDRLGQIRDMTHVDPTARAYQNRNELNPHTDHTEVVALMCLRDAREGGETPLANSLAIHNEILATRPDLMERLYRGYRYHRRGEEQEGQEPITPHRVPVFSRCGWAVSCRLIRPYIEAAAAELGTPLDEQDVAALDMVQQLARDPRFRLRLRLQPGSAVFFNNYTTLHERTPFSDWDEEDRKRHLVRMWLVPEDLRPVVPEIELYGTKGGAILRRDGPAKAFDWGVGGR
jgi:alpha-ketoglutarate-dependent taurine dioxygenase